jgi:hypothetical protein
MQSMVSVTVCVMIVSQFFMCYFGMAFKLASIVFNMMVCV